MSVRRRILIDAGRAAVREAVSGAAAPSTLATAVRFLLEQLATEAPGRTLEVRVPPYGAAQAVEGPRHTRGTPPNVIETDPATWIALATGALPWTDAVAAGRVTASGSRAHLADRLPLAWE
jgi:hypothetical protein